VPLLQSQPIAPSTEDWLITSSVFTEKKIRWAIDGFGFCKTAGEDGIFPGILQQGIETLDVPSCKTQLVWISDVPKAWQKVRVIFIPKLGRSSYELANSFRPIILTSFLSKKVERLEDLHIKEGSLRDYPLNPMQHAYLPCKSTGTELHDLVYKIDGSLAQKEFAFGVFLDVEGAFDNTSFESMDDAASDHGVCATINRWIDFTLRSRSVFVDIKGVIVHMSVRRGCPQSMLNWLGNCNCFVQGFFENPWI
jgi:hypothetical protein